MNFEFEFEFEFELSLNVDFEFARTSSGTANSLNAEKQVVYVGVHLLSARGTRNAGATKPPSSIIENSTWLEPATAVPALVLALRTASALGMRSNTSVYSQ